MYASKELLLNDLFIYLPKYNSFILSDIHIGYEESLNRRGILIPKNNYNDIILRVEKSLETIKKEYSINKIIINGDLVHDFGKVSTKEKLLIGKFIDFLAIYGEVIVIEGNHDKALKYYLNSVIKNNKDISIRDNLILGDVLITHGDKSPKKELLSKIKTIIIGHEHPAINVKSLSRSEKFKCFLKGKYLGKQLIVMPSCNLSIEGTDVLNDKLLSPYLKNVDLSNFEAYIVGDKIYDFGKLKTFKK
ncbi:MAG: metallophosphoesterase [Candidatus Woesearchaeota archaeon]